MSGIDDILEDASDRAQLCELASGADSALLLFYDEDGLPRSASFNLTWANKSYLLAAADAEFKASMIRKDDEP